MKTMKKLQVAIAAASLFAVSGTAMALSISQSGVTIAREVISKNPATVQTLRGPTATVNFDNGPTANASSSQDFNVVLTLGGDGTPTWLNNTSTYETIAAFRRNNGNAIVSVTNSEANVGAGTAGLVLMGIDKPAANQLRFRFRLLNNTAASVSLGDLQLVFNGINPGVGAAPFNAAVPAVAIVDGDYAQVTTLAATVGNSPAFVAGNAEEPAGRTGSVLTNTGGSATDTACGEDQRRITLKAENFIGSGVGVEGESAAQQDAQLTNNGYIVFATALDLEMGAGVAINRVTDPTQNHTLLQLGAAGTLANQMPLGYIKYSNTPVDAWDTSVNGSYYKLRIPGAPALGDFGTDAVANTVGDVDVGGMRLSITGTNGFAAGTTFLLSNSPVCDASDAAATFVGPTTVSALVTNGTEQTASMFFNHAALQGVHGGAGSSLVQTTYAGAFPAAYGGALATTTDRAYICMVVPGGVTQIPQSQFTGQAVLLKDDNTEQANFSCPNRLAGLGGGVKIDVRNFFPYDPANPNNHWVGVIRVINNSETTPADLTGQYIRADGAYGKWGSLGMLAPRGAKYFTSKEINDLLVNNSSQAGADNSGPGGIAFTPGEALPRNTRVRISSNAASTLRVQSYIFNAITQSLVEVSASQGADFVNIEASPRDHIDQDAQDGIKK